jgi:hypothetical protein
MPKKQLRAASFMAGQCREPGPPVKGDERPGSLPVAALTPQPRANAPGARFRD